MPYWTLRGPTLARMIPVSRQKSMAVSRRLCAAKGWGHDGTQTMRRDMNKSREAIVFRAKKNADRGWSASV